MIPRIIARLDIRGEHVVKGIHMEGRRVMGDPHELSTRYYEQGADELLYQDCMASLCEKNQLGDIISRTADDVFVPLTVSGGIRSLEDVREALNHGADRVCVNTAAVRRPELVSDIAAAFGTSTVAVAIDCLKLPHGYEVMVDYGREETGLDAVEWAARVADLGAGEVVLTSIDRDGTRQGFDTELIAAMELPCPLMVSGGAGRPEHALEALRAGADAVALGSLLHYGVATIGEVKDVIEAGGITCRR